MRGYVRFINLQNGKAAVETREGFTVFEVLERCALDISDEIDGPLDSPGFGTLHNVTRKEDFDVSIESTHCNRAETVQLLG